jgi:hypothetical protein
LDDEKEEYEWEIEQNQTKPCRRRTRLMPNAATKRTGRVPTRKNRPPTMRMTGVILSVGGTWRRTRRR